MSTKASWPISGKVLIIDDKYETVQNAVYQLLTKGIPVLFWDGQANPPENIHNVRIIIIDLRLAGQSRGEGFYLPAVQCLNKIPGPYVVIIVSVDFESDDPKGLLTEYRDKFGTDPPGYIHEKGLEKDQLTDPRNLARTIESSLKERSIMDLVLAWESILDSSKDAVLHELILNKLEATVVALIRTIYRDEGEGGAPRGFIQSLLRLQSRAMMSNKELERLRVSLNDIYKTAAPQTEQTIDNLLQWFLMYYAPESHEEMRTGDIYKIQGGNDYSYAIILTPMCDFAQDKSSMVLTCHGCELDETHFSDAEYPLLAEDPEVAKKPNDQSKKETIVKKYLKRKVDIPDRFYPLWNFRRVWDQPAYTGICFDFKNVHAHRAQHFKELPWKRLCRLDSPFIDLMLQRFGFYSSRMGQPDVNRPPPYVPKGASA